MYAGKLIFPQLMEFAPWHGRIRNSVCEPSLGGKFGVAIGKSIQWGGDHTLFVHAFASS